METDPSFGKERQGEGYFSTADSSDKITVGGSRFYSVNTSRSRTPDQVTVRYPSIGTVYIAHSRTTEQMLQPQYHIIKISSLFSKVKTIPRLNPMTYFGLPSNVITVSRKCKNKFLVFVYILHIPSL